MMFFYSQHETELHPGFLIKKPMGFFQWDYCTVANRYFQYLQALFSKMIFTDKNNFNDLKPNAITSKKLMLGYKLVLVLVPSLNLTSPSQ